MSKQLNNVDQKTRKAKGYVLFVCILLACGGLLFGYDNSVISGAIGYMTTYFGFSAATQGWVVSSITLGAVLGSLFGGPLSDLFGRKKILMLSAACFAFSSFGQGASNGMILLIFSRLLAGVAIGIANTVTPIYISEMAPAKIRGALTASYQLVIVTGITIVYFVNASVSQSGSAAWNISTGWRVMLMLGAIPAVIFFLASFIVPESPRWLIIQNKEKRAIEILHRIRYSDEVETEVKDIIKEESSYKRVSFSGLFNPGVRKIVVIGFILAALQHLTGIDAITYYAPEILKHAGLGSQAALYNAILVGLALFVFTLVAIATVDRYGRKILLIVGSLIMAVSLTVVGGLFLMADPPVYLLLTFIVINIAGFSIGMGSLMWVVLGEIFPTRIRSMAMSLSMIALWAANYIVAQFFPVVMSNFGPSIAFFIFALLALITVFFTIKYIPETKGKTLEQIENELIN